jgi:hypothetical protein
MGTSEGSVPSLDLVQRTLTADISYTISRMKVLERLPGNPIGINYRWVDDKAVALMARLPAFSRVVGLRVGHEGQIEPLLSWYREHDIKPRFEIVHGGYWQRGSKETFGCLTGARAASGHAATLPSPAMNSRRRIIHASKPCGSVSRSGSHGNGLYLAGGPTSCDLFCGAGGCLLGPPGCSPRLGRLPRCPARYGTA